MYPNYNISLRIMTGHEIDQPCDLIINMHIQSVVTSPSNEQEGSLIKCLQEKVLCLISPYWEISNGVRMNFESTATHHY